MTSIAAPVDEKEALRMALSIAEGGQFDANVWGKSAEKLQSLLVTICSPSEKATDHTLKIRLDALTTIANQGHSVNGAAATTTPLHAACGSKSIDLVSTLLTFGADPGAKDEKGRKPQQCLPVNAPETKEISGLLRWAELKMTAMQAVEADDSNMDMDAGAKDFLVAHAYRTAAKKMGL